MGKNKTGATITIRARLFGKEAKIFPHHLDISEIECYITNRTKDKGRGCGSL